MTKKILVSFSLAGAMLLSACGHRELPAMGDYSVQVFHDTDVYKRQGYQVGSGNGTEQ